MLFVYLTSSDPNIHEHGLHSFLFHQKLAVPQKRANALKKAGISDFRWHDLRHTWASWLVQAGVPLIELKEMGGWEKVEMVQKYAHFSPEHLHKNAVLVDRLRVACDKNYATLMPQKKNALVFKLGGVN